MDLFALWWPVALVVGADILYQVCAKKLSSNDSPLAQLSMTYLASAVFCGILFEIIAPEGHILEELTDPSIPALLVGVAITGLEAGSIYMYRAGWSMNTGFLVYTSVAVVALLFVGNLFYGETLGLIQLFGVALAGLGMYCIVR